jgi:O-antigen ligase
VEDLRFSLRWLYAGGALALSWGSLQAIYIVRFSETWFSFLARLQGYISTRRLLVDRISGLTYEPHWFAEQIILLLIPFSLAAVMMNYSVFDWRARFRKFKLSVEMLILGWSIIVLPFTFSRAGVLNLILLITASLVFLAPHAAGRLMARRPDLSIARTLLLVSLALLLLAIPVYLVGAKNAFFARVWEYWGQDGASLAGYLSYLGFDARLAYSQAAYNTYLAYPVLGVGLGNYGFYFKDMLPYRPLYEIPEVLNMVTPEAGRDRMITSKNLYLRLLAETGIIGAIAFLAFIITLTGNALSMWLESRREWKYWGAASLSGLIAFFLCAFTFDSFVIPNMWVVFGLITAATNIRSQNGIIPSPTATEG